MRTAKKWLRALVGSLMLASVCAVAVAQNLTLGTKLEVNTLDPHFFNAFATGSSHEMLFEQLTAFDNSGGVKPRLALSWRQCARLPSARIKFASSG